MFLFKHLFSSVVLFLLLILSPGCGLTSDSDDGDSEIKLDGVAYTPTVDTGLTHGETSVSGNGTIVFNDPLSSISGKSSFELLFTLQEGGSLTLSAFRGNSDSSGLDYVFTRNGSVLQVSLRVANESVDISSAFSEISASGNIQLQLDVHNDEVPAHLLAWTGSDFSEEAAFFNSEEDVEVPGNGSGTFWGLSLINARVETAIVSDPKFVE